MCTLHTICVEDYHFNCCRNCVGQTIVPSSQYCLFNPMFTPDCLHGPLMNTHLCISAYETVGGKLCVLYYRKLSCCNPFSWQACLGWWSKQLSIMEASWLWCIVEWWVVSMWERRRQGVSLCVCVCVCVCVRVCVCMCTSYLLLNLVWRLVNWPPLSNVQQKYWYES